MTDNDSYLPLSDPTAIPNYPKKKNWMLPVVGGGGVLAVAVIVVVAFTLRTQNVGETIIDHEEYFAIDTKNVKAYYESVQDGVTGRLWYIDRMRSFYFHNDTMGTECDRLKNDFLAAIFSVGIQIMLPPDDAIKTEKMKVGDVECTNYHGTKIVVHDNYEHHQEMNWRVKNKFVHKLAEVGDDDDSYIKNHKKVSYKYKNFYPNTVCKTYVDDESLAESFHMRKALALLR
ncbi:hypothetical protein P9112_012336 [Eukaryota sp. TZLM1-RC]